MMRRWEGEQLVSCSAKLRMDGNYKIGNSPTQVVDLSVEIFLSKDFLLASPDQ